MAEASRTDDTGITLRIKFKSESIDKFVERYGVDLSPGGIFIRTREPLAVGTKLAFEFTLFDGSPLMGGQGVVAWVRDAEAARASGAGASGMGIRFEKLQGDSQATLNRLLAERAKRQGGPQVRYTAPLMEAVRVPVDGGPPTASAPFKEAPSAISLSPLAALAAGASSTKGPGRPGPGAPRAAEPGLAATGTNDTWGTDDKTELAALPPSFYFDKADKALSEEAGSLAKAVPPASGRPEDATRPRAATPSGRPGAEARSATPSFGAPRAGTPEGGVPLPRAAERTPPRGANGLDFDRRPTEAAGVPTLDFDGRGEDGASVGARTTGAASVEAPTRETPTGALPSGSTPTPVGVPLASVRREAELGGVDALVPPSVPAHGRPLSEPGGPSLLDERPMAPAQAPAPRQGRAGLVIGLAAAVVVGGVWAAPKLLSKGEPAAVISPGETPSGGTETASQAASPPVVPASPAPAETLGAPTPAASGAGVEPPPAPTAPAAREPEPAEEKAVAPKKDPPRAAKPKPAPRPSRVAARQKETSAEGQVPAAAAPAAAAAAVESGTEAPMAPVSPGEPAAGVGSAASGAEELYWLRVRSTPPGAEVLIDGQLEGKTPFQRRIFDITRSYAITVRRAGFEPVERTVSGGDEWAKKGSNVRELAISVKLSKAKEPGIAAPEATEPTPAAQPPGSAEPASAPVTPTP